VRDVSASEGGGVVIGDNARQVVVNMNNATIRSAAAAPPGAAPPSAVTDLAREIALNRASIQLIEEWSSSEEERVRAEGAAFRRLERVKAAETLKTGAQGSILGAVSGVSRGLPAVSFGIGSAITGAAGGVLGLIGSLGRVVQGLATPGGGADPGLLRITSPPADGRSTSLSADELAARYRHTGLPTAERAAYLATLKSMHPETYKQLRADRRR